MGNKYLYRVCLFVEHKYSTSVQRYVICAFFGVFLEVKKDIFFKKINLFYFYYKTNQIFNYCKHRFCFELS